MASTHTSCRCLLGHVQELMQVARTDSCPARLRARTRRWIALCGATTGPERGMTGPLKFRVRERS